MLYYTILYYTILYYTILYYTILYYTILYYTILYYTILTVGQMGKSNHYKFATTVNYPMVCNSYIIDCTQTCMVKVTKYI